MNAADIILLTSSWEESPYEVKGAKRGINPSTNVGDVEWLFSDLDKKFLTNQTSEGVAEEIKSP